MKKALLIAICTFNALIAAGAAVSAEPYDPAELDRMLEGPIPAQPLVTTPAKLPELAPARVPAAAAVAPAPTNILPTVQALQTLPNFRIVTGQILRGGQPTANDLAKLKAAGVKTVINLRNEETLVKAEAQQARALGLDFINIPLDVFNPPSEKSIQRFLKVVDDKDRQPIYVHCLHGQDRTGTMVAIYRIDRQGWNADQAYAEMVGCGFRPGFANLTRSVFAHGAAAGRPGTPPSGGDIMTDLKKRFSHSH